MAGAFYCFGLFLPKSDVTGEKTQCRKPIMIRLVSFLSLVFFAASCATSPPTPAEQADICEIFDGRKSWYRAAARTERKWGTPIPLQMATIKTESNFDKDARPARGDRRLLGLRKGKRPSSARGYTQALDGTWDEYRSDANNSGASRSSFEDATDFIGWYTARSTRVANIAIGDASSQYIAYHQGPAGYRSGGWRSNRSLINLAARVEAETNLFSRQLSTCERRFKRRGLFG